MMQPTLPVKHRIKTNPHRRTNLAFALIGALFLSACQAMPGGAPAKKSASPAESTAGEYRRITAKEAYEMMEAGEVTVVDVRTEPEYLEGHIKGAILIPNEAIADEDPEALPDKTATLLVYCRSGRRSREASEKLLALGYQNIYDFGGVIDWPYGIGLE